MTAEIYTAVLIAMFFRWLLVDFEPFTDLLDEKILPAIVTDSKVLNALIYPWVCAKCSSFWMSLLYGAIEGGLMMGVRLALMSYTAVMILGKILDE